MLKHSAVGFFILSIKSLVFFGRCWSVLTCYVEYEYTMRYLLQTWKIVFHTAWWDSIAHTSTYVESLSLFAVDDKMCYTQGRGIRPCTYMWDGIMYVTWFYTWMWAFSSYITSGVYYLPGIIEVYTSVLCTWRVVITRSPSNQKPFRYLVFHSNSRTMCITGEYFLSSTWE